MESRNSGLRKKVLDNSRCKIGTLDASKDPYPNAKFSIANVGFAV